MKKNIKIIIVICAAVAIAAGAVFGGIAIHDKRIVKNAKDSLSVTNVIIGLQKSDVTVTVDDVLTKNDIECTALFSNNAGSVEINAAEVNEYNEQLTVSLLKPILFNEEIKLDVKISVVDTTAPEFSESIEEIKTVEGDEKNPPEHSKAEELSRDSNLTATDTNNDKVSEQTATVTATDKNNNSSTKNTNVIVEPKQETTTTKSNRDNKSSSSGNSNSTSEDKKPEVKNVSAKDVQNKVNAYIRNKGITVDISMRQNNASWNGKLSGSQKDLNSGWTLRNCKADVDFIVKNYDDVLSMYCYYDGNDFYILYW